MPHRGTIAYGDHESQVWPARTSQVGLPESVVEEAARVASAVEAAETRPSAAAATPAARELPAGQIFLYAQNSRHACVHKAVFALSGGDEEQRPPQ